jgi:GPI mannosyltransferase 1 subunit M
MLLGLSTHWKIYPFIYGVSLVGVLGSSTSPSAQGWKRLINGKTIQFGVISAGTFGMLNVFCYLV